MRLLGTNIHDKQALGDYLCYTFIHVLISMMMYDYYFVYRIIGIMDDRQDALHRLRNC